MKTITKTTHVHEVTETIDVDRIVTTYEDGSIIHTETIVDAEGITRETRNYANGNEHTMGVVTSHKFTPWKK